MTKPYYMAVNGKKQADPGKSIKEAINNFFCSFPNEKACDVYQGVMAGRQFVADQMSPFEYER